MATLTDLRQALKAALSTVDGLEAYAYVPAQINEPAAVVAPDSVTYDATLEHGATYVIPVLFLVGLGDWESAQLVLDELVSHDGAAVLAVNNAAGLEAQVLSMSDYRPTEYGGATYLGARVSVEVYV